MPRRASWRRSASQARFGSSQRRRRRRRRRIVLLLFATFLLVWAGVAAVLLVGAARDAQAAERLLDGMRNRVSAGDLLRGEGREELEAAEARFHSASAKANSPIVRPLRRLPLVGRQIHSVGGLTRGSDFVLRVGTDTLDRARAVLDDDLSDGQSRLRMVAELNEILNVASFSVRQVPPIGPSEGLAGSLADARQDFLTTLDDIDDLVERSYEISRGMEQFLTGPRRYLVLASNNAEMQAGWGMPLSAGVLDVADGDLDLPSMEATSGLTLDPGQVALGGDLARNWGGQVPNEEWRNLALTPRFDVAGPLAAAMWRARGGGSVDGVLAVDPYALRAMLAATGPVDVGGRTVSAQDVVGFALHDQYVDPSAGNRSRAERQQVLSDIAVAAVSAIGTDDVDAIALVEGLVEASSGRHVLAWSPVPSDELAWNAGRIEGELTEDSLLVSLINRGANKLDWFIDVDAELEVAPAQAGRATTVRVEVTNTTPEGEAPYIAGPVEGTGAQAAGDWFGVVTANLPDDATNVSVAGIDGLVVNGRDGPTRLAGGLVLVPRGETKEITFTFELPVGREELRIEPGARARPVRWQVGDRAWADGNGHTVPVAVETDP